MLAGLVVLGTLLTSVAIARGRFLRQWADADKRLRAVKSVDAMLEKSLINPSATVPIPSSGALDDLPGYTWRTVLIHDPSAAKVQAVTVRLQVYEAGEARAPILQVDFLRHEYPPFPRVIPVKSGRTQR